MLNAAVSKKKAIRKHLDATGNQRDGPHNGKTKQRAEIEMESILSIYSEVKGSTERIGDQKERHAAIKDCYFNGQKTDSSSIIR